MDDSEISYKGIETPYDDYTDAVDDMLSVRIIPISQELHRYGIAEHRAGFREGVFNIPYLEAVMAVDNVITDDTLITKPAERYKAFEKVKDEVRDAIWSGRLTPHHKRAWTEKLFNTSETMNIVPSEEIAVRVVEDMVDKISKLREAFKGNPLARGSRSLH